MLSAVPAAPVVIRAPILFSIDKVESPEVVYPNSNPAACLIG